MIRKNRKGSVLIVVAAMMSLLLGFAAISVDVGRLFIIRGELQNAADVAALTGAGYLYPSVAQNGEPNWSLALSSGTSAVSFNAADKAVLTDGSVTVGYWDITGATNGLQSNTITPGPNDFPAVQVTISKSAGQNGGPVDLLFGPIVGINTADITATAIAVIGSPYGVDGENLFPIAFDIDLYNQFWDTTAQEPLTDPSTGQPYVFRVAPSEYGHWTSFDSYANNVPSIQNLILNGNPTPLEIGDLIWIVSGVKNSIYNDVPVGAKVGVPITQDVAPGTQEAIIGFGAMEIISADGGSDPHIDVMLLNELEIGNGAPGGPNYGVYVPAKLVR